MPLPFERPDRILIMDRERQRLSTLTMKDNMTATDLPSGIMDVRTVLSGFRSELTTVAPGSRPSLWWALAARALAAADEGLSLLESAYWNRVAPYSGESAWSTDGEVYGAVEQALAVHEDLRLRRLLVAYSLILCDLDSAVRNMMPIVLADVNEVTWLIAVGLWIELGSGQPTKPCLDEVLLELRDRIPDFDIHVTSVLAGPPCHARDAAEIIRSMCERPPEGRNRLYVVDHAPWSSHDRR